MDPVTAAGIALGSVSLAFQVFDGAVRGFEVFEAATRAEKTYEVLQIRLHMSFDRLKQWAEITGVASKSEKLYTRSINRNGVLVVATLTALERALEQLRESETQWSVLEDGFEHRVNSGRDSVKGKVSKVSDVAGVHKDVVGPPSIHASYVQIMKLDDAGAGKEDEPRQARLKRILKTMQTIGSLSGKVLKSPSRLKWAMRDAKRFEEQLVIIDHLVSHLENTLNGDQLQQLLERADQFNILMLQLTTNVEQMKLILQAGEAVKCSELQADNTSLQSGLSGSTLVATHGKVDDAGAKKAESLGPTALWKAAATFSIEIYRHADVRPDVTTFKKEIDIVLERTERSKGRHRAHLQPSAQQVWVEWRRYPTVEPDADAIDGTHRLVALLQAAHKEKVAHVPSCMGYFDNGRGKFGMVFQYPPGHEGVEPLTLSQCFEQRNVGLGVRVAMAQKLASWLMYLMAVNWLHKGLRSASVLLFGQKEQLTSRTALYVSEYAYSRPGESATSAGPTKEDTERRLYVHPDYLDSPGTGFKKIFDVYSLGIILLEIAFWRPILQIVDLKQTGAAHQQSGGVTAAADSQPTLKQILGMRKQILDRKSCSVLDEVEARMGSGYASATRMCLEGMTAFGLSHDDDQNSVTVAFHLQKGFIEQVVHPLHEIRV